MHTLLEEISKSAAPDDDVNADPRRRRRRARRRRGQATAGPAPALGWSRAIALPPPPRTAARPTRTPAPVPPGPRNRPRPQILETLNSERFCDQAPAQVWATLLDEGTYLASISTMYRLLRAEHQVRERRRPGPPPRVGEARAGGHRHRTRCGPGTSPSSGPAQVDLVPALRDPRRPLPLRRGLARRHPRVGPPRRRAHRRRHLRAAGAEAGSSPCTPTAASSMTSKTVTQLLADLGVAAIPQPAAPVQRQPLQRSPVQDPEVLPDLNRPGFVGGS